MAGQQTRDRDTFKEELLIELECEGWGARSPAKPRRPSPHLIVAFAPADVNIEEQLTERMPAREKVLFVWATFVSSAAGKVDKEDVKDRIVTRCDPRPQLEGERAEVERTHSALLDTATPPVHLGIPAAVRRRRHRR